MELIIVVMFFALTSAVCLQIFVKAHTVDRDTKNINAAIMWGDNLSEIFYEIGSDVNEVLSFSVSEGYINSDSDNQAYVYLDSDYNITADTEAAMFIVSISGSDDDKYAYLDYSFIDKGTNNIVYDFVYKKTIQEVLK